MKMTSIICLINLPADDVLIFNVMYVSMCLFKYMYTHQVVRIANYVANYELFQQLAGMHCITATVLAAQQIVK